MIILEKKIRKTLTRDMLIGMQVIDQEGMIVGKVKDLSLVVGEMDQALMIHDDAGHETVSRWSDVAAVGDVILLKGGQAVAAPVAQPVGGAPSKCPYCGAPLDPGSIFCDTCGRRL